MKLQGQCHRVKNVGTHEKILSQGMLMWNIKALTFTVQKIMIKANVKNIRQTPRSKLLVLTWKTYHKQYSCEISKL